jgi:hypothetical protein
MARRLRFERHVTCMGEKRNAYRIFVRKTEGKRPIRRPRHMWGGGIIL